MRLMPCASAQVRKQKPCSAVRPVRDQISLQQTQTATVIRARPQSLFAAVTSTVDKSGELFRPVDAPIEWIYVPKVETQDDISPLDSHYVGVIDWLNVI